jgi:hypothetical protein
MSKTRVKLIAIASFALASLSCSALQDIQQAMTNLAQLKFKLAGVSDFRLAGVKLAGKSSLNLTDGASLLAAFQKGALPASFTVQVAAINPNTASTSGTRSSSATIAGLSWTLLIDNVSTINGDLQTPVTIPAGGEQVLIPLRMNLDLVQFFKDKGYDNIVKLALALGGASGSPTRLTLRARPTVTTQFGRMTYPSDIDIIDKEFR